MRNVFVWLTAIIAVAVFAAPARAQNVASFLSSTGFDGNTCATPAGPCRTLAGAHGKTNAGGFIYCLDNGEFSGGVTTVITKSTLIDCAGTGASIKPPTGTGITVNATATAIVQIRGLKISSTNSDAIHINGTAAAASLRVEGCDFQGAPTGNGIAMGPPSSGNIPELFIGNTTISNATNGIDLIQAGGAFKVTLDNVRIVNNLVGINLLGTSAILTPGVRVMVKNSAITGNRDHGIKVQASAGLNRVFVKDSAVIHNGTGILVTGPTAAVHVAGSTITQNDTGLSAPGGATLISYGNNQIDGNITADGAFSGTLAMK
jgi:hypothetical protein